MRFLLLPVILFTSALALAGEQYQSRMYIDIEQDATENVALSVSELEKQLDTLDDSSRASAEKFLAQHYAADKDYPKAIARLEDALKQPGQTDAAKRDLLTELARLYVLQKDYDNAAATLKRYLDMPLAQDAAGQQAGMVFLLAQIQYKNKHYVESAAALDKALALDKHPTADSLQMALAIYYHIGNYARSAQVIQQMIEQQFSQGDSNNPTLWQQWVSVELKAGNNAQALTVLSLAWEKGVPFREQDILLLCDLYAINKIPARGARVMEQAMKSGRVPSNSAMNDRLFRLWLQAGERDKAQEALEKAAQLGDDKELQLHLAQLYMEKEQWQSMQTMVLKACRTVLPDALVSRANLLLGISQLKLGDPESARRSFINATFLGGENDKAGQWLAYMKADPATEREKMGVAGPCYSNHTHSIWSASMPSSKASPAQRESAEERDDSALSTDDAVGKNTAQKPPAMTVAPVTSQTANFTGLLAQKKGDPSASVASKTVAAQKLYLAELTLQPDEFASKILSTAIRLGITTARNGGTISGSLLFIYNELPASDGKIKLRMGFPVNGNPNNAAGFKLVNDKGLKCVWRTYRGTADGVAEAMAQLYLDAQLKGYQFTGESRQVVGSDSRQDKVSLELQLGVQ